MKILFVVIMTLTGYDMNDTVLNKINHSVRFVDSPAEAAA